MMSHWIKVSRSWTIDHNTNKRRDNASNYHHNGQWRNGYFSLLDIGHTAPGLPYILWCLLSIFSRFNFINEMETAQCAWTGWWRIGTASVNIIQQITLTAKTLMKNITTRWGRKGRNWTSFLTEKLK